MLPHAPLNVSQACLKVHVTSRLFSLLSMVSNTFRMKFKLFPPSPAEDPTCLTPVASLNSSSTISSLHTLLEP